MKSVQLYVEADAVPVAAANICSTYVPSARFQGIVIVVPYSLSSVTQSPHDPALGVSPKTAHWEAARAPYPRQNTLF